MAFLSGLHYWWPKIFGRMYSEFWAKIAAVLIFIGFNVTFFTQFILGTQGMPRRYYNYLDQYQPLHAFSSFGSLILGAGFFVMLFYLVHSLYKGKYAGKNPWGALTLEWTTDTPPKPHNFDVIPEITHGPYDYDKVLMERD